MKIKIEYGLKLLLLVGLCSIANISRAGHATPNGVEIYYTWLDSSKYEVSYVFYRSCADSAFDISDYTIRVACLNSVSGSGTALSPTRRSISQVKTVCDSSADACGGKVNTTNSGSGLERHVYSDTIDFSKSPFNVYGISTCPKVRFEFTGVIRSSDINTGISGNFYNYAMLDLSKAPGNSSPRYGFNPVPKICENKPVYMSLGAFDTLITILCRIIWLNR